MGPPRGHRREVLVGWVLSGIGSDPRLGTTWIFKGGTCLKKCWLETYRFSEDLDFTVSPGGPIDPADALEALRPVLARIGAESGIDCAAAPPSFRSRPGGRAAEGRVYYRGPRATPSPASVRKKTLGLGGLEPEFTADGFLDLLRGAAVVLRKRRDRIPRLVSLGDDGSRDSLLRENRSPETDPRVDDDLLRLGGIPLPREEVETEGTPVPIPPDSAKPSLERLPDRDLSLLGGHDQRPGLANEEVESVGLEARLGERVARSEHAADEAQGGAHLRELDEVLAPDFGEQVGLDQIDEGEEGGL